MIVVALAWIVASTPAAYVGSEEISIEEVDRATEGRAGALRSRIVDVLEDAAWRVIDRRLGSISAAPRPATDAEIAARRDDVPPSFPPEARDDAVGWIIEREHRERDLAAARTAAREEAGAWVERPADVDVATPLADDRIVGGAGGWYVRGAEVEQEAAVRLFRLRAELYRERQRRLRERIDARLLGREAARTATTPEALVAGRPPSASEVAAYQEAAVASGHARPEAAAVRARLTSRARFEARERLLERLRRETSVRIWLAPPSPPRIDARAPGAPAVGPPGGIEATIVVFGSYGDRQSRALYAALDEVRRDRPDVRLEFRTWVPTYDPAAEEAARLAVCAARRGRFASMHARLLERPPLPIGRSWLASEELADLSAASGVAVDELRACAAASEQDERMRGDADAAWRLGFAGVPALVVAGVPLSGAQSAATIGGVLDRGTLALD